MIFDALPVGVWPLKDYPTLGCSLVECEHAAEHQRPTGGWVAYTPPKNVMRPIEMREIDPELSEREARSLLDPGETLDYGGVLLCRICKGDETNTDSFRLPVKMLAIVPTETSLF